MTPQGDLTYSIKGYNADGTPQYVQTQSYSPDQQKLYDQNNQVATALNNTAIDNISRVQQAQATPFSYDNMTPLRTTVGGNNPFQLQSSGAAPTFQTNVQGGNIRNSIAGAGQAQGVDPSLAGKGVQGNLNYSNLTALPGTSDFSADAQRMANSVYAQAASRLDPQYQQMQSDQDAKLAAQGITQNSDAYRREQDNLARQRTDAYNQATYSAQQAGANEQSRLFGLAMNARQQGQNEADAQGNFTNAAQQQQYQQMLAAQNANQSVQGQNFDQNSADSAFYNQAQGQQYDQDMQNAGLYNTSAQNTFTNNQAAAAFNNQAQNQYFNQDAANATFNNQARQQQIQEATYLRNLPLNDIAALLSGNQAQSPTFQNYAQVGVAAPDYQGIVQSNYNSAMNQYNQQQANRSSALGSIFGAVGTAASFLSDMRFKENIKRIGTLANGLATYAFNYLGDRAQQFGVMAQEALQVVPEAVSIKNGVMYVDYGRVY